MARLTKTSTDKWGQVEYQMKVGQDRFIHFTTAELALEIVQAEKLVPPEPGISIFAVSIVWGSWVPGAQTTHIKSNRKYYGEGEVVGIVFRTPTKPKVGFPEEVKWDREVKLRGVTLVNEKQGAALIKKAPEKPADEDFYVLYP